MSFQLQRIEAMTSGYNSSFQIHVIQVNRHSDIKECFIDERFYFFSRATHTFK